MKKRAFVILITCGLTSYSFGVEKPRTEQDSCVTEECHSEHSGKKSIHDPFNEGVCEACHEPNDVNDHTFELTYQEPELCFQCHDETSKKHVHGAMEEGTCNQCHVTHASEHDKLLSTATIGDLCLQCHEETVDTEQLHGPTAVGECVLCHAAHESDYENLLSMDPNELCLFCHDFMKQALKKFDFVHESVRGECASCHNPHGADNWKMLRAEAPDLCFPCHEDIQQQAMTSRHQHNAVLEQGGCLSCHTPHASSVRYLLASKPITLCLTCHDKPLGMNREEVLPAFDQIKDKKFLHGPIQEDDCSGCHMTHGSEHFRILTKEYPDLFYASFEETTYDLCFGCHEKTLVLDPKTTELTDFRNSDQNLHFLHVNKDPLGRTCRACHQTHASNQPKHIRATVPYGGWKDLPINFNKTETGGSCSPGCHKSLEYDREKAVDYPPRKRKPSSSLVFK